jgi:hypothetical protein
LGLLWRVLLIPLQLNQQVLVAMFQKYPVWQVQVVLLLEAEPVVRGTPAQLKSQLVVVAFQKYPDAQLHAVPAGFVMLRELGT